MRALLAQAVVALAIGAGVAAAAPTIVVRARTQIQIDGVLPVEGGVRVRGRLIDTSSGSGVSEAFVMFTIDTELPRSTQTQVGGYFSLFFPIAAGRHRLSGVFSGDGLLTASSISDYTFDAEKATPTIVIGAPSTIETHQSAEITLQASFSGEPLDLPLVVAVVDPGGPARPPATLALRTGPSGQARVTLTGAQAGGAGDKRVRATFVGDPSFSPLTVETPLRVVGVTRIVDFAAPVAPIPFESVAVLSGRLVEGDGTPVANQPMALVVGSERRGGAVTRDDGRFEIRAKGQTLGPGSATLTVEFASTTPWRRGTRSAPVTVRVLEPRPVPLGYTLGAFAVTFLALAAFVLARTQPWRAWLARFAAWRRARSGDADAQPRADEAAAAPATGLRTSRAGIMSTLRRAAELGFSGVIRDAISHQPIARAELHIAHDVHAPSALASDEGGGFAVPSLLPGTWQVVVRAPGYVSESFSLTVPHRGELRDVRIDLLPVRERVFVLYREVALPLLPQPELWGVWTPREIFSHVRRRRPAGALGALTDLVEEAYFSARTPDEAVLPHISAKVHAVRVEQGQAPN